MRNVMVTITRSADGSWSASVRGAVTAIAACTTVTIESPSYREVFACAFAVKSVLEDDENELRDSAPVTVCLDA